MYKQKVKREIFHGTEKAGFAVPLFYFVFIIRPAPRQYKSAHTRERFFLLFLEGKFCFRRPMYQVFYFQYFIIFSD